MKSDIKFNPKLLAKVVKEAREMLHLSVRQLARASGVSHSQILRIESGEFECLSSSLVQICGALGLPFGEIFERCAEVDLEFYRVAVKVELTEMVKEDTERKLALLDLIFGASVTLSYILRASNPSAVAKELGYPTDEIAAKFVKFAEYIMTRPLDASQRFILLNQLRAKPAATLRQFFDFPSKEQIAAHVALSREKERGLNFPWVPERVTPSLAVWSASISDQFYSEKKDFTKKESGITLSADMKNQWPVLKRRLQRATANSGAKSKLAKFLNVELPRISQWLTDAKSAREPGAEYALQMLHWVEHPELQK